MKRHIRQSNLIESINDPKEDAQSMIAWEFLKDEPVLTHGVICQVHKLIALHQLAGAYKGYYRDLTQTNVRVGNHFPPSYQQVPHLMQIWLDELDSKSPLANHIALENIHPFVDGNGRTGRMLMWWQELKLGGKPTLFLEKEKQKYYKLFEENN